MLCLAVCHDGRNPPIIEIINKLIELLAISENVIIGETLPMGNAMGF